MTNEVQFLRLKGVLARVLKVSDASITLQSSMDDVESWDSLLFLSVVHEVEKEFGVQFDNRELPKLRSVSHFLEALVQHQGPRDGQ